MSRIRFEDFKKLDIRVGRIIDAEPVKNSEKLLRLEVDFGTGKRQAVAGIAKYYSPEELKGKEFVFVLNLEPVKLMGIESNCMILAADGGKGSVVVLTLERNVAVGSRIK